jgi:hypothetical protein
LMEGIFIEYSMTSKTYIPSLQNYNRISTYQVQ